MWLFKHMDKTTHISRNTHIRQLNTALRGFSIKSQRAQIFVFDAGCGQYGNSVHLRAYPHVVPTFCKHLLLDAIPMQPTKLLLSAMSPRNSEFSLFISGVEVDLVCHCKSWIILSH